MVFVLDTTYKYNYKPSACGTAKQIISQRSALVIVSNISQFVTQNFSFKNGYGNGLWTASLVPKDH